MAKKEEQAKIANETVQEGMAAAVEKQQQIEVLESIARRSAAATLADEINNEPVALASGVMAYIRGVGSYALASARASVPEPEVPMFEDPDKGIAEPNPNDPTYKAALEEYETRQNEAAADVLMLLGIELVKPIDKDGAWLKRLRKLERLGHMDLSEFDFDDPIDLELAYKRAIVSRSDLNMVVAASSGMSVDALHRARRLFLGDAERNTD